MTKLAWDNVGERYFETGVDRGVLYVNGSGYPWSGLTSVEEAPTGGEARPYYIDGFKYVNLSAAEEYEATINAFQSPPEFNQCNGVTALHAGLFATQQKRKPFGFSYRTRIGNDVDGSEHGYKIHLIYNALAAPESRSYTTVGSETEPTGLSWAITTMAPAITGLRPTAHFIVDTTKAPRGLVAEVESILYGTDEDEPRLPTVQELLDLFASEGPLVRRNHVLNPSFRAAGATIEVRRNRCTNPALVSGTGNWISGGALNRVQHNGKWWLQAASGTHTYAGPVATTVGKFYAYSLRLNGTPGTVVSLNSTDNVVGGIADHPAVTIPESGEIVVKAPCARATSGTAAYFGVLMGAGATVKVTEALCEEVFGVGSVVGEYFDGSTIDSDGLDYSWTGTADASASIATGVRVANWTNGTSGMPFYKTASSDGAGGNLAEIRMTTIAYASMPASGVIGEYWAARAFIRPAADAPEGTRVQLTVHDGATWVTTPDPNGGPDAAVDIPPGGIEVVAYSKLPLQGAFPRVYFYPTDARPIRVGRVLLEKVSGPGLAPGPFFDGSTVDSDFNFYSWEGTPDASTSVIHSWN